MCHTHEPNYTVRNLLVHHLSVNRRNIIKTKLQVRLTDSPLVIYELVNLLPRHGSIYGSIRFKENLMTGISYGNDFQKIINRSVNHS